MEGFWDEPTPGSYRIGDLLAPVPQLLFDPRYLEPFSTSETTSAFALPGIMMTGLIVADFPTWLWISPLLTPDIYEDAGNLERLLERARGGEEIAGWFYLPPYQTRTNEALAYLEFLTPVPRHVAVKLGFEQVATVSTLARAQLRVALERTLLG